MRHRAEGWVRPRGEVPPRRGAWAAAGLAVFVLAAVAVSAVLLLPGFPWTPGAAAPTKAGPTPTPGGDPSADVTSAALGMETEDGFRKVLQEARDAVANQAEVDRGLQEELDSGVYGFAEPLVVVDPYDRSPLTAVAVFRTESPVALSIRVTGRDALADVEYRFPGFETEFIAPIYGLYADRTTEVTLTATDSKGGVAETVLRIETQPLPRALAAILLLTEAVHEDQVQPGFTFTYDFNGFKSAFDIRGDFRWYLPERCLQSTQYRFGGHFLMARGAQLEGDVLFLETDPLGRIYRLLYAPYGCHHDIEPLADGNLLVTGSDGRNGGTHGDFLYELDAATGGIVATLDLQKVLDRTRPGFVPVSSPDWLHVNAVVQVEGTDDILVSSRHQSAVARIQWPRGTVDWILAPLRDWPQRLRKSLLEPVGEGFEFALEQHAPAILPDQDGNPDTMDLLVFDNGTERFMNGLESYSRIVHFRIDERKGTVEQVAEFGKGAGDMLYAPSRGDADPLPNGNALAVFDVQFGDRTHSANYIELSPSFQLVWRVQAMSSVRKGSVVEYRAERMPIYADGTGNVPVGEPVLDLVPEEVWKSYGVPD